MADHVVDSFSYADNGKVIKKDTWQDDNGQQWDTFTTVGDDSSRSPNGTVLSNQDANANSAANFYYQQAIATGQSSNPPLGSNDPAANRNNAGLASRQPEPAQTGTSTYIPVGTSTSAQSPAGTSGAYASSGGGSNVSVNPNNPLGPNPAPVMPIGTGANPTAPVQGAPNSPSTGQVAGNQTLYNWDNPTQALVNTMRANGTAINPLNPIFQMLMRAAPGLADAFMVNGAGANSQSQDYTGDFKNFLGNALSQGNVPGLLKTAQDNLGSMIPQARAYLAADQGGSPNPLAGNTLLGSLSAAMGANNGSGIMDILSNLNTPTMNRSSSSAYQNLLAGPSGLGSQANFQLGQGLQGGDMSKDFWYYLLGR